MKLPEFDDVGFTPLAWKEWLLYGDKSQFRTKKTFLSILISGIKRVISTIAWG